VDGLRKPVRYRRDLIFFKMTFFPTQVRDKEESYASKLPFPEGRAEQCRYR
jgi:hypothetical protein